MDEIRTSLVQLAQLQDEEQALQAIDADLRKIPARIAAIDRTMAGAESALQAAKTQVVDSGKERRALEQEIEAIKTHISRYQSQILEVKTNEQYRALTHEIANEKRKIDAAEEKILVNMEKVDGLNRTIKEREGALAEEKKRVAAEKAVLEADRLKLEGEKAERERSSEGLRSALPKDLLTRYRKVADTRGGVGLARIVDGNCALCRVRIRLQTLAEIKLFERIVQCETCARILFHPPGPASEAAPAVVELRTEAP